MGTDWEEVLKDTNDIIKAAESKLILASCHKHVYSEMRLVRRVSENRDRPRPPV